MIEKIVRTIDGKLRVTIPTLLNEVTLGQLMELQDKPLLNDLEAISILSGIPVERLQNVTSMADLLAFSEPVNSLSHQITHLYNSDQVPKKITFKTGQRDVTVNVIHNLSVEPAGAFMAAREIIADEINEHITRYGKDNWQEHFNPSLKACSIVLAHYFYCRVTGKLYNEYEVEDFCSEIKKLRVTEALPIAKHFFTCYPGLSKQKTSFWLRRRLFWKRKRGSSLSKNLSTSIP